jgi:hypothetical protein
MSNAGPYSPLIYNLDKKKKEVKRVFYEHSLGRKRGIL